MSDEAPLKVPEVNGRPGFEYQHFSVGDCNEGRRIAKVEWYSYSGGFGSPSHDECVANFRLILAAPELLDACVAALELLRDPDADAIAAAKVEAMLDGVISKSKGNA